MINKRRQTNKQLSSSWSPSSLPLVAMITVALFIAIWFCRHLAIAIVRTSSSPQDPLFPLSLSKSSCSCRRRHLDMYCISSHLICNCRYDPAPLCQGNSIIKQLYCFKNRLWHCHCLNISPLPLSQSQCLSHCHCFSPSQCSHRDCFQSARRNCLICLFWIATSQSIFNRGWGWDESNNIPVFSNLTITVILSVAISTSSYIVSLSSAPLSNHFQWLKWKTLSLYSCCWHFCVTLFDAVGWPLPEFSHILN